MQTPKRRSCMRRVSSGKGFNVMLQALPIHGNGKIVLREHEAKDNETDEAPAEDRTPPRGRNGDGERNAPGARNAGSDVADTKATSPAISGLALEALRSA